MIFKINLILTQEIIFKNYIIYKIIHNVKINYMFTIIHLIIIYNKNIVIKAKIIKKNKNLYKILKIQKH